MNYPITLKGIVWLFFCFGLPEYIGQRYLMPPPNYKSDDEDD